ncbi:NUDIX domain-containing protein [Oscillatoria amoena NRMC-F 0135]|nr:NUDIX domain-containing protein [Oscillatoria amoena NRMC-F 0135]
MEVEGLLKKIRDRLRGNLPGSLAHEPLRAKPVGHVIPKFEHKVPPKPGSVLLLLLPHSDSFVFPLIKRPDYSGLHSGQVSFPGGKAEGSETPEETALREAQEEIGIDPSRITIIRQAQ